MCKTRLSSVQAQIARLSGACYCEWDELKAAARRESFHVVAGGDTYFTRWFVARGTLASGDDDSVGQPATCVVFRGVMWRSAEVNSLRVWQQLSQSWPVRFLEREVAPLATGGVVQAHRGIAGMADELSKALAPHLQAHAGALFTLSGKADPSVRACLRQGS